MIQAIVTAIVAGFAGVGFLAFNHPKLFNDDWSDFFLRLGGSAFFISVGSAMALETGRVALMALFQDGELARSVQIIRELQLPYWISTAVAFFFVVYVWMLRFFALSVLRQRAEERQGEQRGRDNDEG